MALEVPEEWAGQAEHESVRMVCAVHNGFGLDKKKNEKQNN